MPGISENSKRIKKEKKKIEEAIKKSAKTDAEGKNKAECSEKEEGEEGMVSDADSSDGDDTDLNDRPPTMKLLDKYEKYVEYIDVLIDKPSTFYDYTAPFSSSSKFAIKEILTAKNKEEIGLAAFPLRLRIFLVPGLNVLTV